MGKGGERDDPPPAADVEIGAAAKAKRIRFHRKPKTKVEFEGRPDYESDSHTERENLPDEVQPGVTYRDVEIRWRGGARIVERGETAHDRSVDTPTSDN